MLTMWTIPFISSLVIIETAQRSGGWEKYLLYGAVPFGFVLSFLVVGIFWAQISKAGIVEGKFPRIPEHPIYALRRIYGTAWTQVYYFKPLYAVCLAVPILKRILFRGFGYKGDLGVTIYPDSWIRDLPLLKIGKGVYIANRCVVGTNLCVNDGSVIVGSCYFDDHSMVGHLAVYGLGCQIGKKSELGVGAALGMRVKILDNVMISPKAEINHACTLEDGCKIGTSSVIGMKTRIGKGIEIRAGSSIPPGANIESQEQADKYFSSETASLNEQKDALMKLLKEQLRHGPATQSG